MKTFEQYLQDKDNNLNVKRALTDKSYKNIDHNFQDNQTNFDFATCGDAVLKLVLCEKFIDNCDELTKTVENYISDEVLVSVIARNYAILEYLRYDKDDINRKIYQNYNYGTKGNGDNPHKFIATAVEAMLYAIYLTDGKEAVKSVIDEFVKIIDEKSCKNS